ncbi:hypothetical protein TNCV_3127351 [Trichonephila clavipes]|nr:hypothetical protein TNCV_3127351 [Trichonephila clavipes]
MFEKVSVLLNCLTISSEKFVEVDDDNLSTALIMAAQSHFGVCPKLKNIINADSIDENEMNNAGPVPTLSEMRDIMKSRYSYLDVHSNDEVNNKRDVIEQIVPSGDKRKHINSFQYSNDVIHWSPSTINVPSGEKTETHQFSPILERCHPLESFNYTRARPSCGPDRW